jgi:hypothetical protein
MGHIFREEQVFARVVIFVEFTLVVSLILWPEGDFD